MGRIADPVALLSADWRGLSGQFFWQQLFIGSVVEYGLRLINWCLSTFGIFDDLAHIGWEFIEKDASSLDGAKRIPGSRQLHSAGIEFDLGNFGNPDASIRVTAPKAAQGNRKAT